MTTRRIDGKEVFGIGVLSATLGVVATLGTGFVAWGGMRAEVENHEAEIQRVKTEVDRKADKDVVRDGFDRLERQMDRMYRLLEKNGHR